MPTYDLATAEQRLRKIGSFEWLLSGAQWWSAKDVSDQLQKEGIGGHKETVLRWFKTLTNTKDFGGLGLRAKRDDLVQYFAEHINDVRADSEQGA
jgi:hypothetical protein